MSKDSKSVALLVAVALLIGGTFFLTVTREHKNADIDIKGETQATTTDISVSTSSESTYEPPQYLAEYEAQNWFLVHNKKYGYSYYQPEMYPNYFHIETFTGAAESKSLDVFVQEIFELNKSDDNPNIKEESVTEPKKTDIHGTPAYEMVITGVFDAPDRGFLVDLPSRFIFMESPRGAKLMLYYPVDTRPNNVYAQIMKSFRVSETLIPPKESPQDWQEIIRESYSISFPANIFKPLEDAVSEKDLLLTSVEEGVYGFMSASVKDQVFDPLNIQGMYGKIDDAKKFSIQGRDWYQYGSGDAGCGSYIYVTALAQKQTLQVVFGSCPEEDAYPIIDDEPLQRQILETVTFE